MAFERDKFKPFTGMLKSLTLGADIETRCIAENFLLEERLPEEREDNYETFIEYVADQPTWTKGHKNYLENKIFVRNGSPETLTSENSPNLLPTFNLDQLLVRVEDISRVDLFTGGTPGEMIDLFHAFLKDPKNFQHITTVKDFFHKWGERRDLRPVFAGFWGEVKDIFEDNEGNKIENNKDWPNILRDRFGLGHLTPRDKASIPVVVLRYRVRDVLASNPEHTKNFAIPTVLDSNLNSYFCPTPKIGGKQGQTVDLNNGDVYSIYCEILHRAIEYKPDFLYNAGWITNPPGRTLEQARKMHLALLIDSFNNRYKVIDIN